MASNSTTRGGIGLCSLLTVLFVGLKLCDQIDWSWWWVLSPLWIPWAIAFAVMGAIGVVVVAIKVCAKVFGKEVRDGK